MDHKKSGVLVVAAALGFSLGAIAQDAPRDVRDLVGARAASGESELQDRGYYHVDTSKGADRAWSHWWNSGTDTCLTVVTMDGRYDSISDSPAFDCNQRASSSDNADDKDEKVAAAVAAAALIGAVALAHKSHHHDDNEHYSDSGMESEYERGYRDGLYNHSYDNYNNAREYNSGFASGVSERNHETSYRQHGNQHNPHNYSSKAEFSDLVGARGSSAESGLQDRGFRNVDSFKSGTTPYTIWYNRSTRQCLQMATANGRADSIVDIHTHPACH